jgi:type II secretory pathway component PulC
MRVGQAKKLLWCLTATGGLLVAGAGWLALRHEPAPPVLDAAKSNSAEAPLPEKPPVKLEDYGVIWKRGLGRASMRASDLPKNVASNVQLCGTIVDGANGFVVLEINGTRRSLAQGESSPPVKVIEILPTGAVVEIDGKRSIVTLEDKRASESRRFFEEPIPLPARLKGNADAPAPVGVTGAEPARTPAPAELVRPGANVEAAAPEGNETPQADDRLMVRMAFSQWKKAIAQARLTPQLDASGRVTGVRIASLGGGMESRTFPFSTGDVLVKFEGAPVTSPAALTQWADENEMRRKCVVEFLREGKARNVIIELLRE